MGKLVTEPSKPASSTSLFVSMGLDMSWRLALSVLVPIIVGAELDKVFKTAPILLFVGLFLALLGTIVVLWRTLKVANSLPVPKLTAAQKRAIQKQYDEDDE